MKLVVNDVKTGQSYQREVPKDKEIFLLNKKIGDSIDGSVVGLDGFKLVISGGSTKEGFPLVPSIPGSGRMKALLGKGPGIRHLRKGERRKKTVSGNTVSSSVVQVNAKITEYGAKSLAELGFVPAEKKEGEKKEEKPSKKKKGKK